MDNEAQTVIFQAGIGGIEYEIKSVLPSWDLTKWMFSRWKDIEKATVDESTKEVYDEIVKKCFKGWRTGDDKPWNGNADELPGALILQYVIALASQAGIKATVVLKTKKN